MIGFDGCWNISFGCKFFFVDVCVCFIVVVAFVVAFVSIITTILKRDTSLPSRCGD
jgi:hypothetical protein